MEGRKFVREVGLIEFDGKQTGESIEELLGSTTETLRGDEQTDRALLAILEKNILVLAPGSNAVNQALSEIETLASERGKDINEPAD